MDTIARSKAAAKPDPNVVFVQVAEASDHLEKLLLAQGVLVDAFALAGDSYTLPNLIPTLARPSKLDLLVEIVETPLLRRA